MDDGNGKQRQINGLKNEDIVINVKLDLLQSSVEDIHRILSDFIMPGGVCDQNRKEVVRHKVKIATHDKWFGVIVGLLMTLIGLSIKVAFFSGGGGQ